MRDIWKPLSAVVVAAIIAGAITGFPVFAPDTAKATDVPQVTKAPLAATMDQTSDRGWPYRASNVRMVTTDKLK